MDNEQYGSAHFHDDNPEVLQNERPSPSDDAAEIDRAYDETMLPFAM